MKNAYIHIPFCTKKCRYCSFISYPNLEYKEQYLSALKSEIKSRYNGELLETLYFGGGTPSTLNFNEINEIIELFNIDKNTEITMEFNPENVFNPNYKINRLSVGCQTFDDNILKLIGRRHNSQDVIKFINSCKLSNIENINIDLIYGLPNQTVEMFENDLKKSVALDIQHISLYGLKIDEGCYFKKYPPKNLPDNDIQADMYLKAIEILENCGFEHYEISNFSKKGYRSKHNLNYWNNGQYYGFGLAAHGYENGVRYSNFTDLKTYIENPTKYLQSNKLKKNERLEEEIFLGFRKIEGIDIEKINSKFEIDFEQKYKKIIAKYFDFFIKTEKGYALNNKGILISNTILSEFLD